MEPKLPSTAERRELIEKELTGAVLKAFYKTYNVLDTDFSKRFTGNALAIELRTSGLRVDMEAAVDITYLDRRVGLYKVDLLVEGRVALELKSTEALSPNAKRQLLNFIKASSKDVGLLLHYGPEPKFHRVVHPRLL